MTSSDVHAIATPVMRREHGGVRNQQSPLSAVHGPWSTVNSQQSTVNSQQLGRITVNGQIQLARSVVQDPRYILSSHQLPVSSCQVVSGQQSLVND